MPTSVPPRVKISGPDQEIRSRLENLRVQVVGTADPADLAILVGTEGQTEGEAAPKTLDAAGRHIGNPAWTLGEPALTHSQPDAIARASRVTVPPASVAGALILLRPLMQAGLLAASKPLVVSVSGEKPHEDAGAAVMRHALLPVAPRFDAGTEQSGPVVVQVSISGAGTAPEPADLRARQILASCYEHTAHVRVLAAEAPQEPASGARTDSGADVIALQVSRGKTQAGDLMLTARLDRDRTSAVVQAAALMLALETADESPLVEESRDA